MKIEANPLTPPRVSVVLPTYRAGALMTIAVQSILDQTYEDFELILVLNERLRDQRDQLVQEFSVDPRVRFIDVTGLGGLALALNVGIGAARGEYIARMDEDDISLPHRFADQVAYLDAHPDAAVVGGRLKLIDLDGNPLETEYPYYGTDEKIRKILPIRNPMPHPAVMMRRAAVVAIGGYQYCNSSEDYEFFLRMSRNPKITFANLDSVVLLYRRHPAQYTNAQYFHKRFSETAGFLFTETLLRRSPKYLLGIAVVHPWARSLRNLVTKRGRKSA